MRRPRFVGGRRVSLPAEASRPSTIRVGIPNRGRLHAECVELVRSTLGFSDFHARRLLLGTTSTEVEIVCVRSTDLPDLVRDGTVHLGITGNDYAIESRAQVLELADLNMCPGQLCLLVGQSEPLRTIADLPDDTSVVTQYPVCAERFVLPDLPRARIRAVDGAAEVYPTLGLCRAILDVVVTGETARSNGLRVLATFLRTSARLYSSRFAMDPRNGLQPQLDRLVESLARERSGIGPLAERSGLA